MREVLHCVYVKDMLQAWKKTDFEKMEDLTKLCFLRLSLYKTNKDFEKIKEETLNALKLYLDRYFFKEPKFVRDAMILAEKAAEKI